MKTAYNRCFVIAAACCLWTTTCLQAAAQPLDPPPYITNYNPDRGFKPCQRNFEMVWLQIAGSLEHFSSPEPYLRHLMKEFKRVDAASMKATGKIGTNRPSFFTDEYIERVIKNWNVIAPTLALDAFSKNSGRNIRYAMMGSWSDPAPIKRTLSDESFAG